MKIPQKIKDAHKKACTARRRAHAPYSRYLVGAAVVGGGKIFAGCNVENASYGATICAERAAAVKAVSEGVRRFTDVVLVTASIAPPCGMCLQVLSEFSGPETVIWQATPSGVKKQSPLRKFFPESFTFKGPR